MDTFGQPCCFLRQFRMYKDHCVSLPLHPSLFYCNRYKALSITDGLDQMGSIKWELVLCLLASWILVFFCLVRGVRSVGKVTSHHIITLCYEVNACYNIQ